MMEDETKYIKDLNMCISHLEQDKEELTRRLALTENALTKR